MPHAPSKVLVLVVGEGGGLCRAWPFCVVHLCWECIGKQVPYLAQESAIGDPRSVSEYVPPSFCSISRVAIGSVMSVTLSRYQADTIIPAFARCLQSLPNLHTLELCHVHQAMTTRIKTAFEGVALPSVRTVVLPTIAHHVLRSCPNVEDVTCNVGDGSQVHGTIASKCPKVERISGTVPSPAMLKRWLDPKILSGILLLIIDPPGLAKKIPNMRDVSFSTVRPICPIFC
jgi:hypothetical protein